MKKWEKEDLSASRLREPIYADLDSVILVYENLRTSRRRSAGRGMMPMEMRIAIWRYRALF
jgi:hypothetical protein